MKTSQQASAVTPIRMPADLRDWLKHQAIDSRRTLGNEIVFRLEQSRQADLKAAAEKDQP